MAFADIAIPKTAAPFYRVGRASLYIGIFIAVALFLLETLFPTFYFRFDTRAVSGGRNPLLDPRTQNHEPVENGRVSQETALLANMSAFGSFSDARIELRFREDSSVPEGMRAELQKSYRSFLLPTGAPIETPRPELYRIGDTYYELREGIWYPYVSENAVFSRYPRERIRTESQAFLERYPVSEQWLGYRVGSLLSFADGVFMVVSDEVVRPIGSAEIFLGLGYRFEDVIPASAEEVGIYERGRIFLLGDTHPTGTLLYDTASDTYYLVDGTAKRPLAEDAYRDFLLSRVTPIVVSGYDLKEQLECPLIPTFLGKTLRCRIDITRFQDNIGTDYQIRFFGHAEAITVDPTTEIALSTDLTRTNLELLYGKLKNRFLARFGLAQL